MDKLTSVCIAMEEATIARFRNHLKTKSLTKKERAELEEDIEGKVQSVREMRGWEERKKEIGSKPKPTLITGLGMLHVSNWKHTEAYTKLAKKKGWVTSPPPTSPIPKPKKMIIIKLSKEENTNRKHRIEDDEPLNLVAERIRARKAMMV
jgi:hypothetical protein